MTRHLVWGALLPLCPHGTPRETLLGLIQLCLAGAAGVAGSHMAGHIVLTGRAKDTIVLSSGENVEPGPIEDACTASTYIQHMVLLGQDQRMLGALVMPAKEAFDELESVKGAAARLTWLQLCCGGVGEAREPSCFG